MHIHILMNIIINISKYLQATILIPLINNIYLLSSLAIIEDLIPHNIEINFSLFKLAT